MTYAQQRLHNPYFLTRSGLSIHHQNDDARRTAVQGQETSRLAPDMQTRAKNEIAWPARPSTGQLQPYPPNPFYFFYFFFTDDDDRSTAYRSMPVEWE
jgi:hypothetical protein